MSDVKCKFGVKTNATSLDALSAIKVPSANTPTHPRKSNN